MEKIHFCTRTLFTCLTTIKPLHRYRGSASSSIHIFYSFSYHFPSPALSFSYSSSCVHIVTIFPDTHKHTRHCCFPSHLCFLSLTPLYTLSALSRRYPSSPAVRTLSLPLVLSQHINTNGPIRTHTHCRIFLHLPPRFIYSPSLSVTPSPSALFPPSLPPSHTLCPPHPISPSPRGERSCR